MCGGTFRFRLRRRRRRGLSPRVRGNLTHLCPHLYEKGSIPACAGEPTWATPTTTAPTVYPRVCGGTTPSWTRRQTGIGLSPRVRGNRSGPRPGPAGPRSIPACAGEPEACVLAATESKVYPRVCGGTRSPCWVARSSWGLSPRVRGNHHHRRLFGPKSRSIPACAGEPCRSLR